MPTYEYACKSCGEHIDVVQSFSDDELTTCPSCGGPLRKVFGSIGIAFKGSGFYKTDSRSSNGSKSSGSKEGSEKSSESSSDSSKNGAVSNESGGTKESGSPASGNGSGSSATSDSSSSSSSKSSPSPSAASS